MSGKDAVVRSQTGSGGIPANVKKLVVGID